jgi:WhiB family redox-sensing transcriptional regulator
MPNLLETSALPVNFDVTKAACRNTGLGHLFFVVHNTAQDKADRAQARAICASCPVKQECFDYAVSDWRIQGIWGGTTDDQRAQIRKARNDEKALLPKPPKSDVQKFCPACEVEKSVDDFYSDGARKDGLQYRCIECLKAARKKAAA